MNKICILSLTFVSFPAIGAECPQPEARCKTRDNPSFYRSVEMPKALHGHWCAAGLGKDHTSGKMDILLYDLKRGAHCPPENSDDDNSIRIAPGRVTWGGTTVTIISVMTSRGRTTWTITLNHSGDVEEKTFIRQGRRLSVSQ